MFISTFLKIITKIIFKLSILKIIANFKKLYTKIFMNIALQFFVSKPKTKHCIITINI